MALLKRRRGRELEKIEQDIRKALDVIRPILRIEECALTLGSFDPEMGVAALDAKGGCTECDLSVASFLHGIETQLKLRVPEITGIRVTTVGAQ